MYGFSILMFIFFLGVFISGLYLYTGHKSELLLWKSNVKKMSIDEVKNVGKWTMISSIFILLLSIIGLLFGE